MILSTVPKLRVHDLQPSGCRARYRGGPSRICIAVWSATGMVFPDRKEIGYRFVSILVLTIKGPITASIQGWLSVATKQLENGWLNIGLAQPATLANFVVGLLSSSRT